MNDLEVRMVTLEPMRVAVAHGFGEHPEDASWRQLMEYAEATDLLADLDQRRVFGFNNPDPSPGSPNYGYDSWLTVGPDAAPRDEIVIHEFGGGMYAVTPCEGVEIISDTWRALVAWLEDSHYRHGSHQWLEAVLNPGDFMIQEGYESPDQERAKVLFDLYLPVAE